MSLIDSHTLLVRPSRKFFVLYLVGFLALLLAKYIFLGEHELFTWAWRCAILAGAVVLAYIYLRRVTTTYAINAIEITGTVGILSRKTTRIPLNRITNYETYASFVERILGLSDVLIDTPGGSQYELKLLELDRNDAENITNMLRELIAQQKIADAGSNENLRRARELALGR